MDSTASTATEIAARRTVIISGHLLHTFSAPPTAHHFLLPAPCLSYTPPELAAERTPSDFDPAELRRVLDGHDVEARDWLLRLMEECPLFRPRRRGTRVFVAPDYNQGMEQQRAETMRRIEFLLANGAFEGWVTGSGPEAEMRRFALFETLGIYDHSLAIKLGVQFFLWGGAIQCFGTKRHHDKWLKATESYQVKGCFAMTELGHGSNVRGIETVATYDASAEEFVVSTPCESAQKYWIGGAANHATHTIIFSQLIVNGINQGIHALIAQIRDEDGRTYFTTFDNLRVPRENLLMMPNGQYVSSIKDPDQRFAVFLSPLTSGRVVLAVSAVYTSKVALATAVRYALSRRAFSIDPNGLEILLLDYPSHQRRLLPLVAKSCAMSSAGNYMKRMYTMRTPETNKSIHIYSSALKATLTWHNMRTLQECREACGGQGLKTENRIGILKAEFDVQSTFEGDNTILMQQVSKALLAEYMMAQKKKKPFMGLGLEHMNGPLPVVATNISSNLLRNAEFQTALFCLRERDLLLRFASEVSGNKTQGQSRERAIMASYQLAEDLAKALAERVILQSFMDDEMAQSSGPIKDILGLLRSMFAMVCVEEDASFLRYGYLSPDNAAAVRREVMKLCCDLRPHALSVVSSFGIPDAFLGPIAFDWIEANSRSLLSDE